MLSARQDTCTNTFHVAGDSCVLKLRSTCLARHLAECAAPDDGQRLKVLCAQALALQARDVTLAPLQLRQEAAALGLRQRLALQLPLQARAPAWRPRQVPCACDDAQAANAAQDARLQQRLPLRLSLQAAASGLDGMHPRGCASGLSACWHASPHPSSHTPSSPAPAQPVWTMCWHTHATRRTRAHWCSSTHAC